MSDIVSGDRGFAQDISGEAKASLMNAWDSLSGEVDIRYSWPEIVLRHSCRISD